MINHKIIADVNVHKAFEHALAAKKNSHSPYSNFRVGACFKFIDDDNLYSGTNVENASFGATICAERSAIVSAISKNGIQKIEFAVVLADTDRPTFPCALCLQVMSEFCDKDFPVYVGNEKGLNTKKKFKELLPYGFDTLE